MAKAMGLLPTIFSRPPVGAMLLPATVAQMPIMSWARGSMAK